jgi:cystathionine gamma-synthase
MTKPLPSGPQGLDTLVVHAGGGVDRATGAVMPPIHLSTTYERASDGTYPRGYSYSRTANPNRAALEECLQTLEVGAAAACFASGNAAAAAVFQALAPGDRVVVARETYFGTAKLLNDIFVPWGLRVSFADASDLTKFQAEIRAGAKLVWIETPSNPLLTVTDIAAVAAVAHECGAVCVCENTLATPVGQRPLELGADLVVHSTTKYLGGHSDLLGGAVIAKNDDEFFARIRTVQTTGGAVPSPFECWLTLRSVRTLACRVRAQAESALLLAQFLAAHPNVEKVFYPGLPAHPGHKAAARQMDLFGGVASFLVKGGETQAFAVAARTRLFTQATSLGGVESLIEHRASVEGEASFAPKNLLRISVGLESVADLVADLDQALNALGG